MARYNRLALNIVMILLGVLVIASSALGGIGTLFFSFDEMLGSRVTVAGVAFGVGIALAGMAPVVPATWVRISILYCALEVVYEIILLASVGGARFSVVALVISLIFGGLLIFLYPNRSELMPGSSTTRTGASGVRA